MSFGKAPKAPDPYVQADAQTQANKESATYNNAITHGNTYTPLGNQTYTGRVDPVTGATVYDQTISLDPTQQQLLDLQNSQDLAFGQTGNKMLGTIDQTLSNPMDTSSLPQLQGSLNVNGPALSGGVNTGNLPGLFNMGGLNADGLPQLSDMSGYNTDGLPQMFGAEDLMGARKQVSDALYGQQSAYLDPQYADRSQQLRTELANKGVAEGSEAWNRMMGDFERNKSFDYSRARESAITGSGAEMGRLSDIALANRGQAFGERSAVENARAGAALNNRQQLYGERTGIAGMQAANALANRGQMYGEASDAANFQNSTRAQALAEAMAGANLSNSTRAQGLDEMYAARAQPLNEFASLRNGTQVDVPQFSAAQNDTINPADIGGYIGQNYQNQLAAWQQKQQMLGGVMGGLFGLGSAYIGKP